MRRRLVRAIVAALLVVAPAGLSRPIAQFGTTLANQLDRPIATRARYVGLETRLDDRLVVLFFELRRFLRRPA